MITFDGRAKTAAQLAADDEVMQRGTIVVESDTGKTKRHTGGASYNNLPYWSPATTGTFDQAVAYTTADQDNSTLVLANVERLGFPVRAAGVYVVEFTLFVTAGATTTGGSIAFSGPASPTFFEFNVMASTGGAAVFNGAAGVFDTAVTATGVGSTSTFHRYSVEAFLHNGVNAGTLQMRFASEVDTSAFRIKQGSWGRQTRLA